MNFNNGPDVVQRSGAGRLNVPIADDGSFSARRAKEVMAEYGLVEAVLREAIREYQKFAGHRGRRGSRLFREVHQWFLEDDPKWDFSFINVCQILDLEPTYIRSGLKVWSDQYLKANPDLAIGDERATRRRRQRNFASTAAQAAAPR